MLWWNRNQITQSLYKELEVPENISSVSERFQKSVYKSWSWEDESEATGGYFCEQNLRVKDFMANMATGQPRPLLFLAFRTDAMGVQLDR